MKAAPFLALFGLSLLVTLGMIIPEIHLLFGKARVTHQYVRREAQRTIARQCFEDPPRVSSAPPCTFQGCPSGGPFLYVATAYRNRAASYNRWLRTFAIDIQSPLSPVHPSCVCALIANFNDEESGPSLDAALEDWPYECVQIRRHVPYPFAATCVLNQRSVGWLFVFLSPKYPLIAPFTRSKRKHTHTHFLFLTHKHSPTCTH